MKFRKLFSLLLCLILSLCVGLAAACDNGNGGSGDGDGSGNGGGEEDNAVQLDAPVIKLSGNTITWEAVEHADGYDVHLGDEKVTSQTETSYTITQTEVGIYTYTVYATSTDTEHYLKSEVSNSVAYRVRGEDTSVALPAANRIYVVGDSTVSSFSDNYYLPRYGYGTQLYNYLNLSNNSQVVNLALSGRSSLSFLEETNYTTLKNSIKDGDYLIIGFGHNDEKYDDSSRFTHPTPDYQTATTSGGKPSFQYTLYENYVKLAKDKGATPVLCTPIVRWNSSGVYKNNSSAHVVSGYGDYAAAIKKLGADTNTAVVDLTKLTADYYTANNADAKYFHAFTTYSGEKPDETPDGLDSTHINKYGAKMISFWLAFNLPADCPLTAHVIGNADEPTYEVDYVDAINTQYVKPEYKGFNPANYASHKVDTIGGADWYHTAMGTLGGANSGNYKFTKGEGKYTIVADETKMGSKFTGSADGFGAIFTQIAVAKNFTVSAKVKAVKNAKNETNDQIAFGIMLRDDIYIDTNDGSILSNFVSASVTASGKANMSRIDDKANLAYDGSVGFALNTEYEITLERLGQKVTATITNGSATKTTVFTDVSYVGVDNSNIYLCLFANRGLTVEFSDISFEITGDSLGE